MNLSLPILKRHIRAWAWPRLHWGPLIELGVIGLWAIWVGREYLNLDPTAWPSGREFGMSIQSHFVWSWLAKCGGCMLWDGSVNGGTPAFVALQGAVLHPLVIVTTLLFGPINGAKIVLIASLAMAGLAQWWLAKVMRLGWAPRLWSAGMAVVGGHLAGRIENGLFAEVLSTAACSLILAPGLKLALTGQRRAAVQLGVVSALALLAGQGYLQVGTAFSIVPAFFVLLLVGGDKLRVRSVWKEFALAGVLALLLAAILWVPLLHFWPNFEKDADPSFGTVQPLEYAPLNLVIRDPSLYWTGALNTAPVPHLYLNYIGWVPVLLAVVAIRLVPRTALRLLIFFLTAIGLVYLASSAIPFKLLVDLSLDFMAAVRYASVIASLAVPLVLGLAAWGLDLLLKSNWPRLTLTTVDQPTSRYFSGPKVAGVVLALPLIGALHSAYHFSHSWLTTIQMAEGTYQVIAAMKPQTAQWVSPPFGEEFWMPLALDADLKLTAARLPWRWQDRDDPPPFLSGTREPDAASAPNFVETVYGINLLSHSENEYAFVNTGSRQIPCSATAIGGDIDVDCQADVAGTLIVRENNAPGWAVSQNGFTADLNPGRWLSTSAPAGQYHYAFRYRPWDVTLGFVLTLVGIFLAIRWWFHTPSSTPDEKAEVSAGLSLPDSE